LSDQPLVSVITIFLNEVGFLQEAIESVRGQTYLNWELILVDDGSTDGSSDLARAYAASDPSRIRYIEHPGHRNVGTSASRNLGIAASRGALIAFLDGDDVFLPFKLARQVPLLLAQPDAGLLYGSTLCWSATRDTSRSETDYLSLLGAPPNTLVRAPMLLTRLLRNENTHPTICSLLMRRSLVENVHGFDESFDGMYEDTAFLAKAYLRCAVFVTGECSSAYRSHDESTCHKAIANGTFHLTEPNSSRGKFLSWLESYLREEGETHGAVWRALQAELVAYRSPRRYRALTALGRPVKLITRILLRCARLMHAWASR
jgi:glycosyltransferase involved in cell wall biosynthesis